MEQIMGVAVFIFAALWMGGIALVSYLVLRKERKEKEIAEKERDNALERLHSANDQNFKLEQTINTIKNNKEEADEKIDNLHHGDTVDNALAELSNREN